MKRRKFLQLLGLAPVAGAVALHLPAAAPVPVVAPAKTAYSTYIVGKAAVFGEYADYANFSDLALASAIDPAVEGVAVELGFRAGQSLNSLAGVL